MIKIKEVFWIFPLIMSQINYFILEKGDKKTTYGIFLHDKIKYFTVDNTHYNLVVFTFLSN